MKASFTVLAFLGLAVCAGAAGTDYMDAGKWHPRKNVTFADGKITVSGKAELLCRDAFPVDPAKKYKIRVAAARTGGDKPSLIYVAFYPTDSRSRWIAAGAVAAASGTETALAAPVQPGDRVIFVRDASRWKTSYKGGIHYNAKKDLSDIPNNLNLNANPTDITRDGSRWKIQLDKPVKVSLPQGVSVRQSEGGGYFHVGAKYLSGPHVFEAVLSGHAAPPQAGKWWKGTAFARLQLLVNWNAEAKKNTVEITEISLEEE